jgi:hypothetical protein
MRRISFSLGKHATVFQAEYWVPGHAGVQGNEIADGLARDGSGWGFLGPEPVLGVSRRDIQSRHGRWLNSQLEWPG